MAASHGLPDLHQILAAVQIDQSQVLAMYLLGSRMWGMYGSSSDYDIFVIVQQLPLRAHGRHSGARFSTSKLVRGVPVDVMMVELKDFMTKVCIAEYPDLLCFLAPPDCRLYEAREISDIRNSLILRLDALRTAGREVADQTWAQAQKLIQHGDDKKGKKVIGHSLRILRVFNCLATVASSSGGRLNFADVMIDIRAFNSTQAELHHIFGLPWEEYDRMFGPERCNLLSELLGDGCCAAVDIDQAATAPETNASVETTLYAPPELRRLTTHGGGPAVDHEVKYLWVQTLLEDTSVREAVCASSFTKHAKKDVETLHESEIECFCDEICSKLGLACPNPQKLATAVAKLHSRSPHIGLPEFNGFFEIFLKSLLKKLEQERACIFLDVDGVLLPFGAPDAEDHVDIPKKCLDAFAQLLSQITVQEKAPARIVLSSTWRCVPEQLELLRTTFEAYGEPLAGAACLNDMTRTSLHAGRLEEIADWLDAHPYVKRFLVVDDDAPIANSGKPSFEATHALKKRFEDRIVSPESSQGLNHQDVEHALVLLQKQRTSNS